MNIDRLPDERGAPVSMNLDHATSGHFNTLQLLQAYERAIDENIISSITDTAGTILYVNAKFCETAKYSESELLGQNHRIVNSGFHSKDFFRGMWRTIRNGAVWHDEIRNKAKDGSHYWVDTVIVPVKDEGDTITHYLSLRTLITQRKALEKAKAKHLASLEALLVMTSQRVRKPLSTCLKQLDQLRPAQHPNPQELNEIVTSLRSSANELDAFTRELTTFIRDMDI